MIVAHHTLAQTFFLPTGFYIVGRGQIIYCESFRTRVRHTQHHPLAHALAARRTMPPRGAEDDPLHIGHGGTMVMVMVQPEQSQAPIPLLSIPSS